MGRYPGPNKGTVARAEAMAAMYRGGQTLQEIGVQYGVTREAVRQLLSRYTDVTACDGGATARRAAAVARRYARRDLACLQRTGMSLVQWAAFKKAHPKAVAAYRNQMGNAATRGIGWELTIRQWWMIWQASGRWDQRGRHHDGYVMCRYGDEGPYHVNNVFIARAVENIRAANSKPDRTLPIGVYLRPANIYRPFVAAARIDGKHRHIGSFACPMEAHRAYLRAWEAA